MSEFSKGVGEPFHTYKSLNVICRLVESAYSYSNKNHAHSPLNDSRVLVEDKVDSVSS